jgi:DNA-binding NarL/FixJ family response regulator
MEASLRSVRVLIADDDALIRVALSELIEGRYELDLVGTAADAQSAIAMAVSSRPDVAVLDYKMPGGGVYAAREIIRLSPGTAVLCLSAFGDPGTESKMRSAGATGFLIKGASTNDDIVASILAAARSGQDRGGPPGDPA